VIVPNGGARNVKNYSQGLVKNHYQINDIETKFAVILFEPQLAMTVYIYGYFDII
jgi:hypothetical protein